MPALLSPTEQADITHLERQCRDDFAFATSHVFFIRPKEQPLTLLRLNWPQRYVYEHYLHPAWAQRQPLALTILKTRRVGMTTLLMAWIYHKIRWYRGQNCYVVANDDPTLAEIFQMATRFHDHMPPDFLPPVERHNTEQLSYAPPWDSGLRARIAKYGEVGRGTTLHHVLLDELAFYPDPAKILLGVLDAVPRTSASSLLLSSTANGAETWFEAVWTEFSRTAGREGFGGRHWQTVFLPWFWNPYNRIAGLPLDALDAEERDLAQAHRLTPDQLAWRRATLREYERLFPGQGKRKFHQENPSTPEEAFLLAGQCIFPEEALAELKRQERPPERGFTLHQTGTWKYTMLPCKELDSAQLLVWEPPRRGYQYAVGVDVGLGVGGDDSAVVVMRYPGFVTVAHYADNFTAPKQFAYIVGAIADWYGRGCGELPTVTVELNNAGILINTEIETMMGAYQLQPFVWEYWDRIGTSQQSTKTGWLTTWATKHLMVGAANSLLLAHLCHIPSRALRIDMERTYEIKPGVYRTKGADLCMGWLLALVTCYRKFARWDWGAWADPSKRTGDVFPDSPGRPDDPLDTQYTERSDPVYHDTNWPKALRRHREEETAVAVGEALW
jgi:hypothetical protein